MNVAQVHAVLTTFIPITSVAPTAWLPLMPLPAIQIVKPTGCDRGPCPSR